MVAGAFLTWSIPAHASERACPNRDLSPAQANNEAVEVAVLCETNRRRVKAGLDPLVLNAKLSLAARNHASDMSMRNYFDHSSPEGKRSADRARAVGYPGHSFCCGENIAANAASAAQVVSLWMSSPGHRANILLPGAREIGVGVAGAIPHFVQVFSLTSTGPGITGLASGPDRPPAPAPSPEPDTNGSERPTRALKIGLGWRPTPRTRRATVTLRVPAPALGRRGRLTTVEQRRRCRKGRSKTARRCGWERVGRAKARTVRLDSPRLQLQIRRPVRRGARLALRLVVPSWVEDQVTYRRIHEQLVIG